MRIFLALILFSSAAFGITCPTPNGHCALLTWTAGVGPGLPALSYNIWRSTVNGGCDVIANTACIKAGTATTLSFTDSPLAAKTTYYWRISAVNGVNQSPPSPQASGTTDPDATPTVPATPGSIVIQLK